MPPVPTASACGQGQRILRATLMWVMAALLSIPAFAAEPVVISRSADPIAHNFPGLNSSFLGIALGSPYETARARLSQLGTGSVRRDDNSEVFIERDGTTIRSAPYPSSLEFQTFPRGDIPVYSIELSFGTPATSNGVVSLTRTVTYPDGTGPRIADVTHDLVQTFGPFSATDQAEANRSPRRNTIQWSFGTSGTWWFRTSGLRACSFKNCVVAVAALKNVEDLSALRDTLKNGSQVLVSAVIISDRDERERTSAVIVTIEDIENEVLTLTEARKQLEAAAVAPK